MNCLGPCRAFILLPMVTLIAACSSGGSGSDSGSSSATSADDVVARSPSNGVSFVEEADIGLLGLDTDNAEEVVAAVLQAIALAGALGNEDGAVGPLEELLEGAGGPDFDFSRFLATELDGYQQRDAEGFADGLTEIDCPVAGQFVLALNVPDDEAISADLNFSSCDLGDDLLLMGALNIEARGVLDALAAGLDASDSASLSVSAVDLAIHQSPTGMSANGNLVVNVKPIAGGTALVVALNLEYADVSRAISWQAFTIATSKSAATGAYTITAEGEVGVNEPSLFDGQVLVTTPTAFSGVDGLYPDAGELWISGADDRRIIVTVAPAGELAISLYDNDSGVAVPLDVNASWSELQQALLVL